LVCISQRCAACTADAQCSHNLICLGGTCQTPQPGPGPECVDNSQCSGGQVCDVRGQCRPCHFDFECPGQICTSGACRGGAGDAFLGEGVECTQSPDNCPAPLDCVQVNNGPRFCLLREMNYDATEPGSCDPVSNDVCGPITLPNSGGQIFDTTCLLGACVLLRNSLDAADACSDLPASCAGSFCLDTD
jgi:hypothetical protein